MSVINVASDTTLLSVAEKIEAQNEALSQGAKDSTLASIDAKLDTQNANLLQVATDSTLLSIAEKMEQQNFYLASIAGGVGGFPYHNWQTLQALVKMGMAPKIFSLGDRFVCNHETYGPLTWEVIGFDHETFLNKAIEHSMTLQMVSLVQKMHYGQQEALAYVKTAMPAGTYRFTIPSDYEPTYGGGQTAYFTTTQDLPVGSQIVLHWLLKTSVINASISIYADSKSYEKLEEHVLTLGLTGTPLSDYCEMNTFEKARSAFVEYDTSIIRCMLNSDKPTGHLFDEDNPFFRPIEELSTLAGFLHGLDPEFLSVLGKPKKVSLKGSAAEGYVELYDRMFLLSKPEMFGGNESISEGEPYALFQDHSVKTSPHILMDPIRVRSDDTGAGQNWWLRTPDASRAYSYKCISTVGQVTFNSTQNSTQYVLPACCIA